MKTTSGEKTARPGSHKVVTSRKLHRFAGSAHLRVSALAERPRDTEVEAKGPRPANAGGQQSEGQRGAKSESGGSKLAGSGPELEDK